MIRVKKLHLSIFPRLASVVLCSAVLAFGVARGTAHPIVSYSLASGQGLPFALDSAGTRIWFEADATLGRFDGRATRVSGTAEVSDTITFAESRGHIAIEVASFKTGNGMRDGHLRGDMQASRYPMIVFEGTSAVPAELAEVDSALAAVAAFSDTIPAARVFIVGKLTVRDSTREVRIPARVRVSGDTLRMRGRLATRFTDFGMKPPTRLLGTVKVKNDIVLLFDALFRRTGS